MPTPPASYNFASLPRISGRADQFESGDGQVVVGKGVHRPRTHVGEAGLRLKEVHRGGQALAEAELGVSDLDAVAVTRGPGLVGWRFRA